MSTVLLTAFFTEPNSSWTQCMTWRRKSVTNTTTTPRGRYEHWTHQYPQQLLVLQNRTHCSQSTMKKNTTRDTLELGHHEDALREPTSASSPPRATRRTHWTPAPHRRKQPTDLQHAVGGRVDLTSEALPSECTLKNIQHLSSSRVGARQFSGWSPVGGGGRGGTRTNTFI